MRDAGKNDVCIEAPTAQVSPFETDGLHPEQESSSSENVTSAQGAREMTSVCNRKFDPEKTGSILTERDIVFSTIADGTNPDYERWEESPPDRTRPRQCADWLRADR